MIPTSIEPKLKIPAEVMKLGQILNLIDEEPVDIRNRIVAYLYNKYLLGQKQKHRQDQTSSLN